MFTLPVTQNKSHDWLTFLFVSTFSTDQSASMCFLSCLPAFYIGRMCLLWGPCVTCLGCWPSLRSCHSLKMTAGLQGEVDVARWPNMLGQPPLFMSKTRACSIICQMFDAGVWHAIMPQLIVHIGQTAHPSPATSLQLQLTEEVIKTWTTSLLTLRLNTNHAANLDMRHVTLKRGSLCLLLGTLARRFLAGTIEMQTEWYG